MATINKHSNRFLTLVLSICTWLQLPAQIEVTPANIGIFTPESLITNVFLDEGVEVTNITYDGLDISVGYFTNGENDMGIDRGIVMSSGDAATAATANNAGGTGSTTSGGWSTQQEPDLAAIASGSVNDLARYEITFIPTADTLRFKYVFASEEYPEYACSGFNDVFGFFISGPNPAGGNYNGENIALIPDPADPSGTTFTNLPVTINNVNSGNVGTSGSLANCSPPNGSLAYGAYYNNNAGSNTFTYDAYLNIFIAQAIVTPCETYTIKLAVSDVTDTFFDSAVFLEAKSFGTGSLNVETATVSLDGTLTETCSDAAISFILPNPTESDLFLDYEIIGTAENGVDYNTIPDDLFIPAGDSLITINIQAFDDGIPEGAESIGFDILIDPCNRDTFWVYIRDNDILSPELGPDLIMCIGDSAQLDGNLPVTLPDPPTFVSTEEIDLDPHNVEFTSQLQVFGIQPFTLSSGVIKRICIDSLYHSWVDDIDIYLIAPGGQFIELSTDNGGAGNNYINCCFTPDATTPINSPGPFAPPEATPFTGNWLPEGVWHDIFDGDNPTNGFWKLIVIDDTQSISGTLKGWSICFEPVRQFYYSWEPSAGLSCDDCPDPVAQPDVTTTYHLTATDNYGCEVYDSIHIEVFDAIVPPPIVCNQPTENSVSIAWETVPGADSYEINIDSTGWIPADGLSQTIDNLLLGDCVTFDVRGVGLCNGQVQTVECCVPDCTLSQPNVDFIMDASCYGYADGSLGVSATTADPPLTYSIQDIESNETGIFTDLPTGNYLVNIIDTLGCSTAASVTIGQPDSIVSNPIVINNTDCDGSANGSATFEVFGGTAPYQFTWENSQSDSTAINLAQGNYMVTITDQNNCSLTDNVSIEQPDMMSISFEVDSVLCYAHNSGSILASGDGGTGTYSYTWSDGQTDSTAINLTAGIYTLTITDGNDCIAIDSIEVFEPNALSSNTTQMDIGCSEGTNGFANVAVSGGAMPYSYNWSNGGSTPDALDLIAGQYIVTITDGNSCTKIDTVNIIEAAPILLETDSTEANCYNASNGSTTVIATGGTGSFQYIWNDPLNQTTATATGLSAGSYEVIVSDENNCSTTTTISIGQPTEILITNSYTDLNCYQIPDGSIEITATGGTMPYSYLWSNGDTTTNLSNIAAGTYDLTVTDGNNCSAINTITIQEPDSLLLNFAVDSVACNGESSASVQAIVSGGIESYTYLWDNGQSTETAQNLNIGIYNLTVTDANGCEIIGASEVFEPEALITTTSQSDVSCFEGDNGIAEVLVSGGKTPYTYLWSNGGFSAETQNLTAGMYSVTITDANGCIINDAVEITEAPEISLSITATNVSCFEGADGTTTAIPEGGSGAFTFLWNDPLGQTTPTAENLTAGEYIVIITDEVNCTATMNATIEEPTAIEIATTVVPVNCDGGNDGSADIAVSGGTPPYTFNWSNGQTTEDLDNLIADIYFLTVTDAHDCSATTDAAILVPTALAIDFETTNVDCYNGITGAIDILPGGGVAPYSFSWNNGADTEDIENLPAGNYIVTMIDENDCNFTLEINIDQPAEPVSLTINTPELICNQTSNGVATVSVSGGTPPYNYSWGNGEITPTATTLNAGEHFVTVTDSEGCDYVSSVVQDEFQAISVSLDIRDPFCHDGTGSAIVSTISYGNTPASLSEFTYSWSNGISQQNNNNLTAGETYSVTVTSAIGCTGTATTAVTNPGEMFVAVDSIKHISCFGGSDGAITVDGIGGTAPYSVFWGADIPPNANIENLTPGTYRVTVSDINDCSATDIITLEAPTQLELDTKITEVLCHGEANGAIEALANGGVPPYNYAWSNGDDQVLADSISAGVYRLVLTDHNICSSIIKVEVTQPTPILSNHSHKNVDCYEGRDGSIQLNTTGGIYPYRYSLNDGDYIGSDYLIGLTANDYNVKIQDANNCILNYTTVTIHQPNPVIVDFGPDITIELGETVQLDPEVSNTQGLVTYHWSPEDSLNCIYDSLLNCANPEVNLNYGATYKLTVIDEQDCRGEDIVNIIVLKDPQIHVPTAFTPNDDGVNDMLLVHGKEGIQISSFQVFDRWGELVFSRNNFEANSPLRGWDGTLKNQEMPAGVYVWVAEAIFPDGSSVFFNGQATLLR